jgi:hypothetical protein
MKKIIIVLLLLLLATACDARIPQKGDYVRIHSVDGFYDGNISAIDQDMICLSCTLAGYPDGNMYSRAYFDYPFDMCIGTGAVKLLLWLK